MVSSKCITQGTRVSLAPKGEKAEILELNTGSSLLREYSICTLSTYNVYIVYKFIEKLRTYNQYHILLYGSTESQRCKNSRINTQAQLKLLKLGRNRVAPQKCLK